MKLKNNILLLLLLTSVKIYPRECINTYDTSGKIAIGQQVIDLQLTYQSSLDIIDENQQEIVGDTQSISDTIESINDQISDLIGDIEANKKPATKQTIEDLEQQIAALKLQILALNSQLDSLAVLYDTMLNNEDVEIQVQIGTIWDLQIKADSFPYKHKLITKQGFLGGIFDFLGDFDAIFGGVAAFDAAFSILFDILLDFAGGERSVAMKRLRKSIEAQLVKAMQYHKPLPRTSIITHPGIYKLTHGLHNGITINSDNVILDLDNNTILSDSMSPITIKKNTKNIIIKNGSLMGGDNYIEAQTGIEIKEGSHHIIIENIDVSFCHKAIHLNGSKKAPVTYCKLKNCLFDSNLISITLDFATHNMFDECKIAHCFEQTIETHNSNYNNFDNLIEL